VSERPRELSSREGVATVANAAIDAWDDHWNAYAEAAALNPAQAYRRRLILRLLDQAGAPSRLLDLGSGTGDLAFALRNAYPDAEILGIDVSAAGVETARKKVPSAVFLQRDLVEAEPEARYRGWATHAVCSEVLEHVDDACRLLVSAVPYLAPGCRLVVTVPGGPMSAFDRHIGHRRHYRADELCQVLEEAGFFVERATGAGFPFFNLYRLTIMIRGRRLIVDAEQAGPGARLAMRVFEFLFRPHLTSSRWGWQTIALARIPPP
jgi:trans-aconitate methyltransferase